MYNEAIRMLKENEMNERKFKFTISETVKYENGETGVCPIGSIVVKSKSATKAFPKAFEKAKKVFPNTELSLTSPRICDEDFLRITGY